MSETETAVFAFIRRCNLCSLPETEVERDDNVRMKLRQLRLKMDEILPLNPEESIISATDDEFITDSRKIGALRAALAMGDERLAIIEEMAASGNGGATLRLPDAVCECYQIASWLEILTEHRDRANQIEVEKAKYYRQRALAVARSLSKEHLEWVQMRIGAIDEEILARVFAKCVKYD